MMTKDEMTSVIDRHLECYNKLDLEGFCKFFHPEIKTHLLISNQARVNGIEHLKEGFRKLFESSPNLNCKVLNRIVLDSSIIDEEYVTGAATFPNGLHSTAVYGFRDGLIDRVWFVR